MGALYMFGEWTALTEHSHPDGSIESNLEFSVFLKDTSTCVQEGPVSRPPTLRSMDDPLYLLSHSRPHTVYVQMLSVYVSIHYAWRERDLTICASI